MGAEGRKGLGKWWQSTTLSLSLGDKHTLGSPHDWHSAALISVASQAVPPAVLMNGAHLRTSQAYVTYLRAMDSQSEARALQGSTQRRSAFDLTDPKRLFSPPASLVLGLRYLP